MRIFVGTLYCTIVMLWSLVTPAWGAEPPDAGRGEYLFQAAGGCTCHTDLENKGAFMAGGRAIKTPFGRVYSTNITPEPKTGIGNWTDEQFVQSMTQGIGPDGKHYFPVFPYTSFTRMKPQDVLDLKAYLMTIPAVEQANRPPDMTPPFGWRFTLGVWKWLYFAPGPFVPQATQPADWNRGAYLTTALGHCGECHTPRTLLGGLNGNMFYAGSVDGPEGQLAPNITPDADTGIGGWSVADVVWYLQTGLKPNGDDTQGLMSELIEHGYKHLSEDDLRAIALYLRSLKPIRNKVVVKKESENK